MKKILKTISWILGGLIMVGILGAVILYLSTSGEYQVLETVSDDPALPRMEINGVTLHLETFGDPQNPTVIVLHGGPGGDHRSLLGLEALADEYQVVFYDQRGAGLSQRVPPEQLTVDDYYQELDAIVDHFGEGDPVNIIGHSWGGMLLSGYLGYAPDKVSKAVLAEPGFLNEEEMADWTEFQNRFYQDFSYLWFALRTGFEGQHVSGPDQNAGDDYLYTQVVNYFANHPDNPYHCPGEEYDAPGWRFGAAASKAAQAAPAADINSLQAGAEKYQGPALFLAGECNTWIGPELQAKHATMYSNGRLEVIPNAGHNIFWDNPRDTLAVVRSFLEE